jgi:hypothetical protein
MVDSILKFVRRGRKLYLIVLFVSLLVPTKRHGNFCSLVH